MEGEIGSAISQAWRACSRNEEKKLQRNGLVRIQKYELDGTGKKVLLYKSKSNIASFEFKMERGWLHISH